MSLYDLATGRGTERVDAGMLSYSDGFDGRQVWHADATGMPVVESNAVNRLDALAMAHFYGRRGPERPVVRPLRATPATVVLRLTYRSLPEPLDVSLNARTALVERIEDPTDGTPVKITFSDYRVAARAVMPFSARLTAPERTISEHVVSVEELHTIPASAFAPPAPPNDTALEGITSVAMRIDDDRPIIPVRIDGGPTLHMLLDSGSVNVLATAAARRLHLVLAGADKTGGIGAGLETQRFTRANRLEIGAAVLRRQPFAVMDSVERGTDGAIGCEVFERLAVRLDFENRRVQLARDARSFGELGAPVPMRLNACSPEVDGSVDGIGGPLLIDTGSGSALDVFTPVVRKHRLIARYEASVPSTSRGTGGALYAYWAYAGRVRLGRKSIAHVPIELDWMERGAFSSTANLGNVGIALLRAFTPAFDYRRGTLWLLDATGGVFSWPCMPSR